MLRIRDLASGLSVLGVMVSENDLPVLGCLMCNVHSFIIESVVIL